jgi:hypothetical protein
MENCAKPVWCLDAVWEKALDSLLVLRRNFVHLVKHASRALRLSPAQVRLAAFGAHDFPCAGDFKAALGLLVGFHLRHRYRLFPDSPRDPTAPFNGAVSHAGC